MSARGERERLTLAIRRLRAFLDTLDAVADQHEDPAFRIDANATAAAALSTAGDIVKHCAVIDALERRGDA